MSTSTTRAGTVAGFHMACTTFRGFSAQLPCLASATLSPIRTPTSPDKTKTHTSLMCVWGGTEPPWRNRLLDHAHDTIGMLGANLNDYFKVAWK